MFSAVSGIAVAQETEARPIALVGDSYGKHEITRITRAVLDRADWVFEDRGDFLPAGEFSKYAIVVISTAQKRPYSTEEHALIRKYLEGGGRLLLIQQAPQSMADAASSEAMHQWFGMTQQGIRKILPEEAVIVQHPILKGVIPADGKRPSWIDGTQGVIRLAEDVQPLIGAEGRALVAWRRVGKGSVAYLGSEMFRLRQQQKYKADSDSYVTLVRNILAEANPLTLTGWHNRLARDWRAQDRRFLVWNREWQRGTEDRPVFLPPLPEAQELVSKLSVSLALDEFEALQLNLTDLGKGGKITWKVGLDGLPQDTLRIFVQDRPPAIPWPKDPSIARESPYWLMPPEAVDPKAEQAVTIPAGGTRIFWLKFDSHDLKPGKYQGSVVFAVDGQPAGSVALDIAVHPVRVPERRRITVQPVGHVYGDVNNAPPALRFKRNLRDLGFEWTLINTVRPGTFTVEGEPLNPGWIKTNLDAILSTQPPFIDFSSMDEYVDAAIEHNLTYFRITGNLTEAIKELVKGLPEEQQKLVRHWFLREFRRYLEDKGIRVAHVSMGDEMSVEELKERFIPWSEDLAEAGWQTTSSFTTSVIIEPGLAERLAPLVGSWTLNRMFTATFTDWLHSGKVRLPKGALVGNYGAGEGRGTEIRKNASESRMIGWESWAFGTDYCGPNPYFKGWLYYVQDRADRGAAGERFVSYLDINDLNAPLVNSPFIEGIRESLEEANLAAIMSWYLERLGDRVPEALRARADHIANRKGESILHWKSGEYQNIPWQLIDSTREEYARAKEEVLAILDALRPLAREAGIQPSLFWNDVPLIDKGRPVATVVTSRDVSPLQTAIQKSAGQPLPSAEEPGKGTTILVASLEDPGLPKDLKDRLGPHPQTYSWIRQWKHPKTRATTLWIGGTDSAQTDKALRRFIHFLRSEGADFVD